MLSKKDLFLTKDEIQKNIGHEVILEFNKGRKKAVARKGIISNVYPSIFTVQLFDGPNKPTRKLSFSYVDVLTSTVLITLT